MRTIGEFSNEQEARRLGDYLYANGIANDVDEEDGEWEDDDADDDEEWGEEDDDAEEDAEE